MALTKEEKIAFLRARPFFNEIGEQDIAKIADRMNEERADHGDILFLHEDPGRNFYIIYSGKVRIWRIEDGQEVELAIMGPGDEFGEEALLFNRRRSATITSVDRSVFLTLTKYNFDWMIKTFPELKSNFHALAETHQQARRMDFDWLQEGEMIYLISRRHGAELWRDMAKPAVGILLTLIFFGIFSLLIGSLPGLRTIVWVISGVMFGLNLLWFGWEAIDWSNDYFIITNQRVVWLEKVILQSFSRQEAPMHHIQFVSTEQSYWGRVFDFGDVFIRTHHGIGSLSLSYVRNPKQFRDIINEQIKKASSISKEAEEKDLRQSVRKSLGLEAEEVEIPAPVPETDPEPQRGFRILKTREIDGDAIIYHKHVTVMLRKTISPVLSLTVLLLLCVLIAYQGFLSVLATVALFIIVSSVLWVWLWYQYTDYKNDLYKVTLESVIDSEKKPFGKEETQSAPLKNIQSIKINRTGLLRIILNFGTVNINVADQVLDFIDVSDPAQIQRDIFYRQTQMESKEQREEEKREQDRMGLFLKAYHEVWLEEQEKQENEQQQGKD